MTEMIPGEYALALKETDMVIVPAGSTEVLGDHGPCFAGLIKMIVIL